MQKKSYFFIFLFFLLIFVNLIFISSIANKSPEKVIDNLYKAIDIAKAKGDYNCCIEPDCTMCYLGHWKFEKGTCYCDDAIKGGRDEDVCPECVKGLEEGLCTSTTQDCLLDGGLYG